MADLAPIDIAAFWSRAGVSTPFQCWIWTGQKNDAGYGRFKRTMAHRVAYALIHGPIPEGLIVRHRCDNKPCCNPYHLLLGTNRDNSNDAMRRGRLAYGERSGKTKLTAADVSYIRQNPQGLKIGPLAAQFGVCKATISYIRSGRSWKMVGAEGFEPPTDAMSRRRSPAELSTQGSLNLVAGAYAPPAISDDPN